MSATSQPPQDQALSNLVVQKVLVASRIVCSQLDALQVAANKFDGLAESTLATSGRVGIIFLNPFGVNNSLSATDNKLMFSFPTIDTSTNTFVPSDSTYQVEKTGTYTLIFVGSGSPGATHDINVQLIDNTTAGVIVQSPVISLVDGIQFSWKTTVNLTAGQSVYLSINRASSGSGLSLGSSWSMTLTA